MNNQDKCNSHKLMGTNVVFDPTHQCARVFSQWNDGTVTEFLNGQSRTYHPARYYDGGFAEMTVSDLNGPMPRTREFRKSTEFAINPDNGRCFQCTVWKEQLPLGCFLYKPAILKD